MNVWPMYEPAVPASFLLARHLLKPKLIDQILPMALPMMRLCPIHNCIAIATRMAMIDLEKDQIIRGFEREVTVAHQLLADVVQAVERVLVVARPLFEGERRGEEVPEAVLQRDSSALGKWQG